MKTQTNNILPQFRQTMLVGASVAALFLGSAQIAQAGSLTIEGEGAWLAPFGDEVIFATRRSSPDGITFTDTNNSVARGEDFSIRGLATWRFGNGWSVGFGAGAANFDNTAAAPTATLYNALPDRSFLFPQITTVPDDGIGFCFGAPAGTCEQVYTNANARLDTDLDFIDFEIGWDVGIGNRGSTRFFAGLRYARFDETLRGSFSNNQYFYYYSQTLDVTRKSSFDGLGPRIGFTADIPIGNSNFSFGGTFAVAALFGEVTTNVTATHTLRTIGGIPFNTNNFASSSKSSEEVVYTVEVAPQISYNLDAGGMSGKISVGYRFDHYLGMVDTATRQSISGTPPGGDNNDDVKFDGPFLRVGMTFGKN